MTRASLTAGASAALLVLSGSSVAGAQWGEPQTSQQPGYGQQQQQPGYGQQQNNSGMSAGGLAPPESSSTPAEQQAEKDLKEAEEEDSGRGLEFFYINGEAGFMHVGLETFNSNDLVDAGTTKTKASGPVYGAGLGLRLVFITIGPRFRLANLDKYQTWSLNAELGIRIPLGNIEPYFTLGGGYSSIGTFDSNNVGQGINRNNVDITGYNVRGGLGLDIYLSPVLSIGANFSGEVMFLTRPGVDVDDVQNASSEEDVYKADGSSVGAGTAITGVLGLHF